MFLTYLRPLIVFSLLMVGQSAPADLVLRIESKTIQPRSDAMVDVFIRSTDFDTVGSANYFFEITALEEQSSDLRFALPQSDSETSQSNYLFAGKSDLFTAVRQTDNRELAGGDATLLSTPVQVGTDELLLTTLDLQHIAPPGGSFGRYLISLRGGGATAFNESFLPTSPLVPIDPRSFDTSAANPNFGGGIITVTAAAVPEPSSALFVALASLGIYICMRKRVTD